MAFEAHYRLKYDTVLEGARCKRQQQEATQKMLWEWKKPQINKRSGRLGLDGQRQQSKNIGLEKRRKRNLFSLFKIIKLFVLAAACEEDISKKKKK